MVIVLPFAIGIGLDAKSSKSTESITQNLMALPKETLIYPGHGERTRIRYEEEENIFSSGDSMAAAKQRSKLFAILADAGHETGPMDFLLDLT